MKYLKSRFNVEIKDHRYRIHPTENVFSSEQDPPKSYRTQYHVQNETQIRKNEKVFKIINDELVVKNYFKKKQQIKFQRSICPS